MVLSTGTHFLNYFVILHSGTGYQIPRKQPGMNNRGPGAYKQDSYLSDQEEAGPYGNNQRFRRNADMGYGENQDWEHGLNNRFGNGHNNTSGYRENQNAGYGQQHSIFGQNQNSGYRQNQNAGYGQILDTEYGEEQEYGEDQDYEQDQHWEYRQNHNFEYGGNARWNVNAGDGPQKRKFGQWNNSGGPVAKKPTLSQTRRKYNTNMYLLTIFIYSTQCIHFPEG